MTRVLGVVLALWLATADAAVLDGVRNASGTLVTAQTATGGSANTLNVGRTRQRSLVVTMWNTAGTATAQLEINCSPTLAATGWALVAGSSSALTVSTAAVSVVYPLCQYRVNATACSACSLNAIYNLGPEM